MSAYGTLDRKPSPTLASTLWKGNSSRSLTLHHLTLDTAPAGLVDCAHSIFAAELEKGDTYPQELLEGESLTREAFTSYFFGQDVIVAILQGQDADPVHTSNTEAVAEYNKIDMNVEQARANRDWADVMAGFYYVKPNYPGRSSHICNAGFVVTPDHRGSGFGKILAKSYLFYAPLLGYKASVFNLVYVNNIASIKLWEKLGFTKAGKIPQAGRLKCEDGSEKYFDAWVFYKSFDNANNQD